MSSLSPASVLFDQNGLPLAVSLTSAIPANTSALINISDGYVTTAAPSYTTGTYGSLSIDTLGNLRTLASQNGAPWILTGNGTAGSPASGVVTVQGITGGTPLTVSLSGTGNAIDGYVTTAAPAYTNNTTNYLSLTTVGALRVDGSAVTQPVSQTGAPWSTSIAQGGNTAIVKNTTPVAGDQALVVAISPNSALNISTDGYVTTAAPVYVNNTSNLLSLTTAGALRVDGSGVTQPVSGTVTSNQGGAPWTFTGTGTAGTPATGVISVQGITGGTPLVVSLSGTGNAIDGYVTTAAPAYTNNTTNYLSLTTTGNLRVQTAAESATAAAVPANADYVGSLVVSTPPTLTAGNLTGLNSTTAGRLIVDGSQVTQPVSQVGTWTVSLSGTGNTVDGYVTTAAPAYANNSSQALSLDTSGNLRVITAQGTSPWVVSGTVAATQSGAWSVGQSGSWTVTANAGTGNFTVVQPTASALNVTAVGAGTAGTPSGGVMSIQGVSGGTPLNVTSDAASTGTMSSVAASTSSVQLLAANANRVGAAFFNDSTNTMYLAVSATAASLTAFTIKCLPGTYTDLDVSYTGIINAIWNGTNGACRITQWTT